MEFIFHMTVFILNAIGTALIGWVVCKLLDRINKR